MNPKILSCIVVDDEQYAIDVLSHFIKETPALQLIATFTDPRDALNWTSENHADIVFLDINMPKISGLDLARTLKDQSMVILCSAYSEYGVESYNHNVVDYLLKPVEYPRFMMGVQKAREKMAQKTEKKPVPERDFILISSESRNRMIKINHCDIYYLSAAKNYLNIHLRDQVVNTLMSLKEAEAKLPHGKFIRVHNSYVVATDKIKFLDSYNIVLHHCTEPIPISASYRKQVLELLNVNG